MMQEVLVWAAIIMLALMLIVKACRDAFTQIEHAKAIGAALEVTDHNVIQQCTCETDGSRDVEKLIQLEEGFLCLGSKRLVWKGGKLLDANCCATTLLTTPDAAFAADPKPISSFIRAP